MSFATRHSKGSVFQCETEGFEYFSLEQLFEDNGPDMVYPIQGLYINKKGNYGDAPVAICAEYFVNLPGYMTEECSGFMKSEEDIEDIKAGKVGFRIEQYEKVVGKTSKTCYGVRWVDL